MRPIWKFAASAFLLESKKFLIKACIVGSWKKKEEKTLVVHGVIESNKQPQQQDDKQVVERKHFGDNCVLPRHGTFEELLKNDSKKY